MLYYYSYSVNFQFRCIQHLNLKPIFFFKASKKAEKVIPCDLPILVKNNNFNDLYSDDDLGHCVRSQNAKIFAVVGC